MKRSLKAVLASAMLIGVGAGFAGCDPDYSDRYPEAYAQVVRIKDSGRQAVTVYSTDERTAIPVTIQKGGWEPDRTTKVKLRAMTAEEFEAYKEESAQVFYTMVPDDILSFSEESITKSVEISFSPSQGYSITHVYLDAHKINEFNNSLAEGLVPIVPVVLETNDGTPINGEDNMLFMEPTYLEPTLTLKEPKAFTRTFYTREGTDEISIQVNLPVVSKWDFNINLDIDEDLLNAYNEAYGTKYVLMPENVYSGYTGPEYAFTPGVSSIEANITVDVSKLSYEEAYALPIVLRNNSHMNIEVEPNQSALYGYTLCPPKMTIDQSKVTVSDEHPNDGGGKNALFDGNTQTYYQSGYNDTYRKHDPVYGSYVDVELNQEINVFAFDFYVRHNYYNGAAQEVALYFWDNDTNDWVEFGHTYNMLVDLSARGKSGHYGNFIAPKKFTKMRFSIIQAMDGDMRRANAGHWNCGELVFYGSVL